MIRTAWVLFVVGAATAWFGSVAIVASLLGRRGGIYTWATRGWSRAILRASRAPVTAEGMEHVRSDRAQVIVSNHASWFDIFAIAAVVPGPFHFVGKRELDRIPLFGRAWRAAGHVSVDRSNRQSALESMRAAGVRVREEGGAVIVFAEGTRSRDGALQPFKKGAFALAAEVGIPVVPTVVLGSREVMPADRWRIRPHPVRVRFGEPVSTADLPLGSLEELMAAVRGRMKRMLAEADR